MAMLDRTAVVLYGSETGTAQDGAEEIGRMLSRSHFAVQVYSLNEVDPTILKTFSVVVATISTTGQGDLPNNAKAFWKKILRAKLSASFLNSLKIAVFGFGDSSYPKYNHAALKLHKRLLQLGATSIVPMGKGDEQHPEGHEATFLPWMIELEKQLEDDLPLPKDKSKIPEDVLLQPSWLLDVESSTHTAHTKGAEARSHHPITVSNPSQSTTARDLDVELKQNKRVTPEAHWQDVRHISFSSTTQVEYLPGDVLVIYPHNPSDHVQELIELMSWQEVADTEVVFLSNPQAPQTRDNRSPSFRSASSRTAQTLRDLLTEHLDINSIPRRSFFSMIAHFTSDEYQRNRLLEFSNTEYLDELYDYTTRPRRSILEVLQEFDTVKIPWQWAAIIFPTLRGRQFSIASGGQLAQGTDGSTRVELLVAVVKYKTVIRKIRRGVCSRYLESLEPGSKLTVTLLKGDLGITAADVGRPIVLVGPGTGVAPIRSLLWQKLAWSTGSSSNDSSGQNLLFYGCRNKESDYFFQDEWQALKHSIPLDVYPAFSRDQGQKQYVQDLIKLNSKPVYSALCEDNGLVFVCGSSGKMPVAVRAAIKEAILHESSMTVEEVELFLVNLEKTNRYKQETW